MKISASSDYQTLESLRVPGELSKNADPLALFPEVVIQPVCDLYKQLGKSRCRWATDNVLKNTALPDDSGIPGQPVSDSTPLL